MLKGILIDKNVICDYSDEINKIYSTNLIGHLENKKFFLSFVEALFLMDKEKLELFTKTNRPILFENFLKKASKFEDNLWIRFCVFRDLRKRGYIVKTALKFGGDFRVYDKGVKPGEDHAKWVVFPVGQNTNFSWFDFAAKSRVAHSTRKRLLIALVDDESDVTYYEIAWKRP